MFKIVYDNSVEKIVDSLTQTILFNNFEKRIDECKIYGEIPFKDIYLKQLFNEDMVYNQETHKFYILVFEDNKYKVIGKGEEGIFDLTHNFAKNCHRIIHYKINLDKEMIYTIPVRKRAVSSAD